MRNEAPFAILPPNDADTSLILPLEELPVPTTLTIDSTLVASYLDRLYDIGRLPDGGVWRPVYSPAWDEARQAIRGWLSDAGLSVREDAVGNLFGRLEGATAGPVLLVGSHIDSVYAGGKFDGPLG